MRKSKNGEKSENRLYHSPLEKPKNILQHALYLERILEHTLTEIVMGSQQFQYRYHVFVSIATVRNMNVDSKKG